jgi:hypothetical protein
MIARTNSFCCTGHSSTVGLNLRMKYKFSPHINKCMILELHAYILKKTHYIFRNINKKKTQSYTYLQANKTHTTSIQGKKKHTPCLTYKQKRIFS